MNLLDVEKPSRYMGGEMGAIRKENPELRIALAFPDVYEVGMSHLGLRILYHILNDLPNIAAERVYAPWPDMEKCLESESSRLATLESATPLSECHVIGFTLQYELSYTNILNMLRLAGIPLWAEQRDESSPLIIGGGPCSFNPEPLAPFFDAFLLGDGEDAVSEIALAVRDSRRAGEPKMTLLERLAAIEGVYIPSFYTVSYRNDGTVAQVIPTKGRSATVRRRILKTLHRAPFPTEPVVPFMKTIHDRVAVEIARGCTRGCRFCQAGYLYRPVRERSPGEIMDIVERSLGNTGYDDISLLSLSTGDYSCIAPLLANLMKRHADNRVAVSLPSLRVGTLHSTLMEEIKKVRKTGFTLAPEAGSENLRKFINKDITEADLLDTAGNAYSAGWRLIKLYFMIGLPGETMGDVMQIADLSRRVKDRAKGSGIFGEVNVSVSTFVPKSHTPFQWERQISLDETRERQALLKAELKKRKLNFKWHDPYLSFIEGVFARGDRRLAPVLEKALELECRFDGWGDHFSWEKWEQAFRLSGVDASWYLRQRDFDEVLPWSHLDCGVSREFLRTERQAADASSNTPDCRQGECSTCGVCDFVSIAPQIADFPHTLPPAFPRKTADTPDQTRIRMRFSKTGAMSLLSHLELITLFTRALSKASVPIIFSRGFHPHPKFSFATATSVGIESNAEYADIFVESSITAGQIQERLNRVFPEGLRILEASSADLKTASLSTLIASTRYKVTLSREFVSILSEKCAHFLAQSQHIVRRVKKGVSHEIDLRTEMHSLSSDNSSITMVIGRGKPIEFVRAITGRDDLQPGDVRIEKCDVRFIA